MSPSHQSLIWLCRQLSDCRFHRLSELSSHKGYSHHQLKQGIAQLKKYGIPCQQDLLKGFRLLEPMILLEIDAIQSFLTEKSPKITLLESTSSTNDYLLNQYHQNSTTHFCLAERQTQGRGRFNRNWHALLARTSIFPCITMTKAL